MLPPWLKLVTGQPQLLAEHAEAYGELLQAEATALSTVWRRAARVPPEIGCASSRFPKANPAGSGNSLIPPEYSSACRL